jgi:hypothetical protein
MEKEYDFFRAEQGKFYRPIEELEIPVYLDKNIELGQLINPLEDYNAND